MGTKHSAPGIIRYEKSARRDLRFWALLIIGAVFAWGGLTIDPATNCSEGGECAPILVPIAALVGLLSVVAGLAHLSANASNGSELNLETGELRWWQGRTARFAGDVGSINARDITLLRIRKESEGADEVHLYDREGARQHFFDSEVIPWRYEEWGRRLVAAWPHIQLDVIG